MSEPAVDDETFQHLKATVERFVTERLVPNEMRLEIEDEVPEEIVAEMRELGLFGLTIPPEYGGIGLTASQETQLAMTFGGTALAFRSLLATNIGIGARGLIFEGTEDQKQAYLPRMASGELISAFALTEPDTGSDPANLTTRAVRDGDDYLISGTKRYITNAQRAGVFTVMARTEFDKPGADAISAFLVPSDSLGLTIGKKDRKMGQRGTTTSDVIFENVRVPASAIIGLKPGRGFRLAMRVLDRGRIHIAALATGACKRLIAEMTSFAKERRQFGKPIAEYQLIQAMIADSYTEYLASRALVEQTAAIYDREGAARTEASAAKYFATEAVGRVADRAVQVHGGAGYMSEYAVERFYRDVRLMRIYEGTSQIQQLLIARQILKEA
ncbi:MAG: acyl-CoA dehydrogenase family protein [Ramlibacter sp.]|jgi:acyl-CoA dehydrogenase|uniref:acyl-CoA dehydrogenase family protein n=1 Tax=Methylobacterium sp. CCH7-A2 TaxID=1768789 RepID=UPI0008365965|nr:MULTISPECIES: acyl-CoA dehydrogenase family protein [Hyphomicrobiales]MDP3619623.1 acyl-CoA dehydrogenase family protein [Ramlibacter sp.]